jgi:hypothetical protein
MGCMACAGLVLGDADLALTRKASSPTSVVADSACPGRLVGRGLTEVAALPGGRIASSKAMQGGMWGAHEQQQQPPHPRRSVPARRGRCREQSRRGGLGP